MKRAPFFLLFALLAATPLASQAYDPQGWYAGFGLGISRYGNQHDDEQSIDQSLAQQGFSASTDVNDNPLGLDLGIGYRFNRYFALEANYIDLGRATAHSYVSSPGFFTINQHLDASGGSFDGLVFIPVSERVSLFGKLGLFDYSFHTHADADFVGAPVFDDTANGSTFDAGVGVEIRLDRDLALRAGLTQYHGVGDVNTTGKQNIGYGYARLILGF